MDAAVRHPGASRYFTTEKRLTVAALHRLDDLDEVRAALFVVAGFPFKAAFPFRVKVHHGPLEERAFVTSKLAPEQRLADGFHVAVNAKVAAVDHYLGKGAA